jgi:mannose-6-phosphate isomerase-like protein (cupin superfamily)
MSNVEKLPLWVSESTVFINREVKNMSIEVRRVITGHDQNGKAIVMIDDNPPRVNNPREGIQGALIWTTDSLPAKVDGTEDKGDVDIGTTLKNGSVFRIAKYDPGVAPRVHRTQSIDYAVVISGEIDMELEDGVEVHLKSGDVLVQRATVHNWINRGSVPCIIAFILISADVDDLPEFG